MELKEIARDVYACLQPDRGLGWSNSGLVNRGGGLVVDTFWDLPRTRELVAEYERVRSEPIRRVVNTHENGDHCWGNQLFEEAEILGHKACAEGMEKFPPAMMQALKDGGSGDPMMAAFAAALEPWDFNGITVRPPTVFVEDRLALDLDGIAAELLFVGPAHTPGDVIVHLPAERIVFAGDILFRLCTPIGWEGTTENWIAALERIAALEPETIVPGHGPLCGAEGARELAAYFAYVKKECERFAAAGVSEVEAAKRIDLGPYADWTEPERLVFNVGRCYREIRGEPWDTPVDALGAFQRMFELRESWNARES